MSVTCWGMAPKSAHITRGLFTLRCMGLGDMAGRTARHPTGTGATARATPRQRLALAPPPGEPWAVVHTRQRYQAKITKMMLVCAALVAVGNFLVLTFDDWLKLPGAVLLMVAVVLAGISPAWRVVKTDIVIEDQPRKPVDARRARQVKSRLNVSATAGAGDD